MLVVDDQRDEVLLLMMILREEGYEVRGAYGGRDVIDVVRDFEPQAVLLDIGMPDMNGYDAARELRRRHGDATPLLVAVTGWKQASDKLLAQLAGFHHHVAKPYDARHLLSLLKPLQDR